MRKENEKISKHSNKCTLTGIHKKKNGFLNPAIVTFLNGELKDHHLELSVVLTSTNNGTSVEVQTSNGHVFKESNISRNPNKSQIIAIRNKKSNKMRLVEIDNSVLINSALVTTTVANNTVEEHNKEIKTLYRTFGGKKAISQVIRSEKLNFSSMPVANELKQTIAEMKVEADASFNNSEIESIKDLLPPCNREATVLSDIYQIQDILSEKELESLKEEVNVMEGNKFNPKEYSEFFINCYSEAKKSDENLKNRLAGVLFAETIIKFLKIQPRSLASKKLVLCPFSAVISEKLLNEFCIKKEHSVYRPLNMKDKCLFYIMAVSLACCNYKINLKLLQASVTPLNLNRLLRLARILGAVPLSKESYVYILKLPLPMFPVTQKGRLKRK